MNRVDLVLQTSAVSLTSFDHPPGATHDDPPFEIASRDSINFVEDGSFSITMERKRWELGPGSVFVATRGMGFSCTHDSHVPSDRCLCVMYDEQTTEDLHRADVPALRPPVARSSPRQRYLRHRLRSCGPGQEIRLELLAGALFESCARDDGSDEAGTADASRHARRVDRAMELIETQFARRLTLRDLAGAAGMSPFHFARAFRALTGLPPHRYLTAVRLRHALRLLREGAGVTFTCYEVGFGSLSHFITSFGKRFDVAPSDAHTHARDRALRASLSTPIRSVSRR